MHNARLAHRLHPFEQRLGKNMLRISFAQTDTEQRWTLCGQLAGPWVTEVRECWEYGRKIAGGAQPLVDLSEVTFIDEGGEKLLSEMTSNGAKFVAAGVETKHLLDNLRVNGERALRRVIAPRSTSCEKSQPGNNKTNGEKNEKSV
jgi:hypothetical protein